MKAFAALLERLAFTPARNAKLLLLRHYLDRTPDPDRGWALAALTGDLELRRVTPGLLRGLAAERMDAQLFALSYDFVGDLAETIALIWPEGLPADLPLADAVTRLQDTGKAALPATIAAMLDRLGQSERLALLKLATGNLRVGVSARMARMALAQMGAPSVPQIEEIWHGLTRPMRRCLAGSPAGRAPKARRWRRSGR